MTTKTSNESDEDERHVASPASFRQSMAMACDDMLSKLSAIRQTSNHTKPAELFRKDLISAMKLPDTELLNADEYYEITDGWRQEWEKGVQVPVNLAGLHSATFASVTGQQTISNDFKIAKKYLQSCPDEQEKQAPPLQEIADQVVRYDLDEQDVAWLTRVNQDRARSGDVEIHELVMERVLEALETQCHENMHETMKTAEGLGIEYDESVICDVCRSPDSEETNEMVFCDKCDICVHQACYGIEIIPEGSWLCRICALGLVPPCILCPNKGGAMKSTRSGTKWCHVSCALWIPEVSIGFVEKMEPITNISHIPESRWALICCLCRERVGACIQCSVKTCKTAFHVTCAFSDGLEMKTVLGDEEEDVKLKGYCPKHSKMPKDSEGRPISNPCSPKKIYTEEEKENLRQRKIRQLQNEFYTCVDVATVATSVTVPLDVVRSVYEYWRLKRKTNHNRPLLMPKTEEADLLSKQQEDSLVARMKMFVHLRQDLERVRNLCYMVSRREKTRKQLYKMKELIFDKQLELVLGEMVMSSRELQRIMALNHNPDIYDNPDHILQAATRFDDPDDQKIPLPRRRSPIKSGTKSVNSPLRDGLLKSPRMKDLLRPVMVDLKESDSEGAKVKGSDSEEGVKRKGWGVKKESKESDSEGGSYVHSPKRLQSPKRKLWKEERKVWSPKKVESNDSDSFVKRKTWKEEKDYDSERSFVSKLQSPKRKLWKEERNEEGRTLGRSRLKAAKRKLSDSAQEESERFKPGSESEESAQGQPRLKSPKRLLWSPKKDRRSDESEVTRTIRTKLKSRKLWSPKKQVVDSDSEASRYSRKLRDTPERERKASDSECSSRRASREVKATLSSKRESRKSWRKNSISEKGALESVVTVQVSRVPNSRSSDHSTDSSKAVERPFVDRTDSVKSSSSSTTSKVSEQDTSQLRVKPLRVVIPPDGLKSDSESTLASESDDSSVRSSSTQHSGSNGIRSRLLKRKSLADGYFTPIRFDSPPKKTTTCTLISPGKLKLTISELKQEIPQEPIEKNKLCESFVKNRNRSPYKNKDNNYKQESKSNKRRLRNSSTVSVEDMLRLRRHGSPSESSEQSLEVVSDSDSYHSKRSRGKSLS